MSIKDLEKVNARQMETLRKKQNREISHLENGHSDLKSELKAAQALELVDLQNENIRKVASENDRREKVLGQMKSHLENTEKLTEREIKDLKDYSAKIRKEDHEKLSVERERVKSENDLHLEEMSYRFNTEQAKINEDGQTQMSELKHVRGTELKEVEEHLNNKIDTQTTQFTEKFQADGRLQQKMNDDLQKQYKNQRAQTNLAQQQEVAKVTETHTKHLEVRDNEFRKGLKTQDQMFEQKYNTTLANRNVELKNLEDLNTKVMTKMKSDLSETLKKTVNRADDPFYSFTELKPKLTEFPDRVEIKVTVPEHAKTDMQLTIHGKEAIVNFNRRYDDARKDEGVLSKLHKVESFTSRVLTSHHLDPKSVKSSFADGTMTYVVKRA